MFRFTKECRETKEDSEWSDEDNKGIGSKSCEECLRELGVWLVWGKGDRAKDMIAVFKYVKVCHKEDGEKWFKAVFFLNCSKTFKLNLKRK